MSYHVTSISSLGLFSHGLWFKFKLWSCTFLLACVRRSYGVGWGGAMLTFLVLRTLYVATLQRSLVLLIRCIHERLGWGSKSKDLLLYVKCWQWQYVNLHARLQQKNISTLKRLVWKDSKKRLSNWSRENLAKFGSYKCAFRCSENNINKKNNVVFTSTVPSPPGCFCWGTFRYASVLPVWNWLVYPPWDESEVAWKVATRWQRVRCSNGDRHMLLGPGIYWLPSGKLT